MNDDVYTIGIVENRVGFDPSVGMSQLTSLGDEDIFIQKLDSGGELVWARQMGRIEEKLGISIAVDRMRAVYSTGIFRDTVDFAHGVGVR